MNNKLTVIIPARNEPYLSQTVDDLFAKAVEEIEIIVILDGYWPTPPLINHQNLIQIHRGAAQGMRQGTNMAVEIASGKYLMKVDAHCMFAKGFDRVLKSDCESNWLVVPRRYSLDAIRWKKKEKPAVDYLYLTYPYGNDDQFGFGFHGRKWIGANMGPKEYYRMEEEKKYITIDDIIAFQGSCWFMHKNYYFKLGKTEPEHYFFYQEAQELGFKVWLSGGRVVRNKRTWYAHWHKNKAEGGRGYHLSNRNKKRSQEYSADLWMNNKWPGQKKSIQWLVHKFWPMTGWPEEWGNYNPDNDKALLSG